MVAAVHPRRGAVARKHSQDDGLIEGHARFARPHAVGVNGRRLEAPKIFINVGGRALVPDIPGLDQVAYLTNSTHAGRRFPAADT